MIYLISIHTVIVSNLLMITGAASEEENFMLPVFLRIKNIVVYVISWWIFMLLKLIISKLINHGIDY